jgi:hypothetical protein
MLGEPVEVARVIVGEVHHNVHDDGIDARCHAAMRSAALHCIEVGNVLVVR